MKQEHAIVLLIGLAAAGVFVYLWIEGKQAPAVAAGNEVPPGQTVSPVYPNAQPIQPLEVGSSPINLTYNTFPPDYQATGTQVRPADSKCGNGGCNGCGSGCDDCAQAQTLVTKGALSQLLYNSTAAELEAFNQKKTVTPAPQNRVTFTAA